ncbi:MAG: translation initiation factor IF-2, partial [Thermodesulfobacteriota bacterium]
TPAEAPEAPAEAPAPPTPTARIIVMEEPAPAAVAESVEPPAAEEAPAPQPEEPAPAEAREPEAPAAETPAAEVPEAAAPAETPAEAPAAEPSEEQAPRKKKGKKREVIMPTGPQVRIISMPEPKPEPPARAAETARPERPAGPRPAGPRPAGPRPAGPPPGPGAPAAADDDRGRKKGRKKDKRVVEFAPHLTDEEARRAASISGRKTREDGADDFDRNRRKRRKPMRNVVEPSATQPIKAVKRKVRMEDAIRVADMAKQMGVKAQALIKILFGLGMMATINQSIDFDTATLVAQEFEYEVERVGFSEEGFLAAAAEGGDDPDKLKPRPPVVTIMGHVDHGKTSLLDAIRSSEITSGEAGGITQHIGAYDVDTPRGKVVFLDTPGHEAFTAMRARGAKVTDIVVLVVAADDGVMDQTREAVSHARAAGVPIVVAVNKIDKPEANPDRVMRELSEIGLASEAWGGDTIFANVSAKKHMGIDELLELLLLQAEVLELKANPDKPAMGRIVEARLDKGRGPVATVLIQQGTLKLGDAFVCGVHNGKVRNMFNDVGRKIKDAGPSIPVEVQGFDSVPEAGDEFVVVEDEKVARRIASERQIKLREKELAKESKVTLESFLAARKDAAAKTLNLLLKADVQGSLEAIADALNKLSTDEVKIHVVHSGAGAISESDILLATASEAIIIGFNVKPTAKVKEIAERENVDIRFYDIIYKLVAEVKDAMTGMLEPVFTESYLGQADVLQTFSIPKVGAIAGCRVMDGVMRRNAQARLLRNGVVVYTGRISSLKRIKDDAKEVAKGYECGIGLENYNDIKIGDVIETFEEVQTQPTLG